MTASGYLSGKTLGRYRIGPLLGRGGMGEVYRAEDTVLRRAVAIKVLPQSVTGDAARLARFVQEARTASALNHPHLVSIYEIGEAQPDGAGDSLHFIAMELVPGETLRQVIDGRRADQKRVLEYLAQAADAIAAAHGAGIVHRDLKPDNIMVADAGYAKVLDFGVAKLRGDGAFAGAAGEDATVTRAPLPDEAAGTAPGVVMGTVGYMSPEQAQGLPADHRSDVFSFGCVLYEAASGSRPFTGSSAIDTLHKIIHTQPAPLTQFAPSCPPELQRIVRKCLAKSPDERYQSMKDLALDLRDLRREIDSGGSVAVSGAVVPVAAKKLPPGWIAALAVLIAAGALAAWLMQGKDPAPASAEVAVERITATGLVIDAVISRDGKYIAYVQSDKGRHTLWLRQRSGGRPLELIGTDGGFWGIAFTPDATSIYYALKSKVETLGALFAIQTLGGSPRRLLSGIDSAVTFSPDGSRIAYLRVDPGGQGGSSLMIAGANGENPQPLVTKRPPEFLAPGFFVTPSWSPDGRRIAAAVRNSQLRKTRLTLFPADGGPEEVFPHAYSDATFTAWLPDGSGIVVSGRMPTTYSTGNGGQLWLQPYPSGEVRRITRDILEYRTASLTGDGKSILSVVFESTARLSLRALEGNEERRLAEDRSAGPGGLAWSADGQRLFYMKAVAAELQIWSMSADGTGAHDVVRGVRPSGLAVSRDGAWIAYGAEQQDKIGVWRAKPDGTDARLLAEIADPGWLTPSPDGRHVYFTSSRDGSPATYRLSIEGGEPALVARGLERAVPSPDGRFLAGQYKRSADAPYVIAVLNPADGTVVHEIANYSPAAGGGGFGWTPDGKSLLFTTVERMNIWKEPVTGGTRENVTNFTDLWVARWALSPDGKTLFLSRAQVSRDAILLTNFR